MRWDSLRLEHGGAAGRPETADPPALFGTDAVARTFETPGFRGITFYEIRARSIINQVPPASRMAFRWTINPYRGCSHGCVYCFARHTHTYLDMDAGLDFNSKIIVKVNAAELARRELASPRWRGEHVAMGTNVDCYQRAEGRYRMMPGIISALRDAANPFSILTKGTLILRDIDLLADAAQVTDVGLNVSVGFVDKELSRSASSRARQARSAGSGSAPRSPPAGCAAACSWARCCRSCLTHRRSSRPPSTQIAQAGASHVSPIVLHLRPGAREWFMAWLARAPPRPGRLATRSLYGSGAYAPRAYQQQIADQVRELAAAAGVGRASPAQARRVRRRISGAAAPTQAARPAAPAPASQPSSRRPAQHGQQAGRGSALAAVSSGPHRQSGRLPGPEAARQVGGGAEAEILQGSGGQAGGVAL